MARRIESINKIEVYEENGKELKGLRSEKPSVILREHWNVSKFVVITIRDLTYTVLADDLKKAIQNVENAHS